MMMKMMMMMMMMMIMMMVTGMDMLTMKRVTVIMAMIMQSLLWVWPV